VNASNEWYDVTLKSDGTIIYKVWEYDQDTKSGRYIHNDVTDTPCLVIDKFAEVEAGFTLADLFHSMQNQKAELSTIFSDCYITEYIDHAAGLGHPAPLTYDPSSIEYLELAWEPDMDNGYVYGIDFPFMNGKSWELREDFYQDSLLMGKKGERIRYGTDFMDVAQMMSLPITLNEDMVIYKSVGASADDIVFKAKRKFTVGDIIKGVMWELSFYGLPEDTHQLKLQLEEMAVEIDETILQLPEA